MRERRPDTKMTRAAAARTSGSESASAADRRAWAAGTALISTSNATAPGDTGRARSASAWGEVAGACPKATDDVAHQIVAVARAMAPVDTQRLERLMDGD